MSRFGIAVLGASTAAGLVTLSAWHQENAEPVAAPLQATLLHVPSMMAGFMGAPVPGALQQSKINYGRATLLACLGPPDPEIEEISSDYQEQCPKCSIRDILRSCYARSLSKVYGTCAGRVVVSDDVPDIEIGYQFRVPEGGRQSASSLLRDCVESFYGIRGARAEREMEVLVLKHPGPHSPQPATHGEASVGISVTPSGSYRSAKDVKLADLAAWIARRTGKPVVDETRLERTYDWELTPKSSSLADLNGALAEIGLSLEHERRMIDVVVVKKLNAQS